MRLEKDGENWYIKSFTLEIPADELPEEDPVPTMEPGYPLGLLLTQETAMRKDASDTAELCDSRPLQEGEYVHGADRADGGRAALVSGRMHAV